MYWSLFAFISSVTYPSVLIEATRVDVFVFHLIEHTRNILLPLSCLVPLLTMVIKGNHGQFDDFVWEWEFLQEHRILLFSPVGRKCLWFFSTYLLNWSRCFFRSLAFVYLWTLLHKDCGSHHILVVLLIHPEIDTQAPHNQLTWIFLHLLCFVQWLCEVTLPCRDRFLFLAS